MSAAAASPTARVPTLARLADVTLRYGRTRALDAVSLELPAGCVVGAIGPDGVGKSSLLSLVAGARAVQRGRVEVLDGDIARAAHRRRLRRRIAYMPQGLGRNLYPTLSVRENVEFFARLFGQPRVERERRIAALLAATGLAPFADRPAARLSGGMKQKLGLCCALVHDPDLLILDEPTTGIDPLSRRQFWELVDAIRRRRPGMSLVVATAYMEEAARFDWLVAMDGGRVLATGTPAELRERTGAPTLDAAFIALVGAGHERAGVAIPPRDPHAPREVAIEAEHLTMRFGDFTAVDDVSFSIERGEIFGFLGSNGSGKTTTMKMLTGLLAPTEGRARLFGREVDPDDVAVRRRVGYMSQSFSLYSELTVAQNLALHARLFGVPAAAAPARIAATAERFGLARVMDRLPPTLPLGMRQRLSLAVAMVHAPDILILDEPTSGVDPIARDAFWRILVGLSRNDDVTIFVSTHFMNEAERCDRVSFMHAGKVLVSDTPAALVARRASADLEDAFIACLSEAMEADDAAPPAPAPLEVTATPARRPADGRFDLRRMLALSQREALELARDPIRATLALLGSLILMFVIGYGINMDVEELVFAVLDRDDTTTSRGYVHELSGSRYFVEHAPLGDHDEIDRRMRDGELSLALEIPPGFARDVARGREVAIGAWIDGAMPARAETVRGYVEGMHATWLAQQARGQGADGGAAFDLALRFRYNPDVRSLNAIVPAVIPLLLMLIPAMLAVLSVVREKELGSITNFYVTPVTRLEFLLGKQLPYVGLAMLNFLLLVAFAVAVFRVPVKGDFAALVCGALVYVVVTTGMGLLISTFMNSQIAAIFGTALITLIPATQYSGMIDPVSSLEGAGALIGRIYPTTHFMIISRGTFSKALGFEELAGSFLPLLLAIPVMLALAAVLLRKQAS